MAAFEQLPADGELRLYVHPLSENSSSTSSPSSTSPMSAKLANSSVSTSPRPPNQVSPQVTAEALLTQSSRPSNQPLSVQPSVSSNPPPAYMMSSLPRSPSSNTLFDSVIDSTPSASSSSSSFDATGSVFDAVPVSVISFLETVMFFRAHSVFLLFVGILGWFVSVHPSVRRLCQHVQRSRLSAGVDSVSRHRLSSNCRRPQTLCRAVRPAVNCVGASCGQESGLLMFKSFQRGDVFFQFAFGISMLAESIHSFLLATCLRNKG